MFGFDDLICERGDGDIERTRVTLAQIQAQSLENRVLQIQRSADVRAFGVASGGVAMAGRDNPGDMAVEL